MTNNDFCEMTLRDYFAAASLNGVRSGQYVHVGPYPSKTRPWEAEEAARFAYADADAMIAERKRAKISEG